MLRYYRIALISIVLAAFALVAALSNSAITTTAATLVASASFAGFLLLIALLNQDTWRLTRAIVWSGAIVGLGSLIEMTLFRDTVSLYFHHSGRPRSISTLLNPNNLGVYQGACFVLWAHMFARARISLLPGMLIVFAFVASGSRTAFVSLLLTGALAALWDRALFSAIIRRKFQCVIAFIAIVASGILGGLLIGGAAANPSAKLEPKNQAANRTGLLDVRPETKFDGAATDNSAYQLQPHSTLGASPAASLLDLTTFKLRLEFLMQYVSLVDASLLLPDFTEQRSQVVHDNAYLSLLNSHGAVLAVLLCVAWHRRPIFSTSVPPDDLWAYRHVIIFYLISGLSNSFVNSFPNNQLFFIAAGVWLVSPKAQPYPGSLDRV